MLWLGNGTSTKCKVSSQDNSKKRFSGTMNGKEADKGGNESTYTEPNYTITHRGHFDIQVILKVVVWCTDSKPENVDVLTSEIIYSDT